MEKTTAKTEEEVAGRSLLDLVFSWSIRDVLNRDLYKNQVCMNAILSCLCVRSTYDMIFFFLLKSVQVTFLLIKFGKLIIVKSFRDFSLHDIKILLKQDQSWHELRLDPSTFLWKGLDQ
jgi:hypothetical protein